MKPRAEGPRSARALLLAAWAAWAAEGARSRVAPGPCRPACQHGGLCLPQAAGGASPGTSHGRQAPAPRAEAWGCFCKAPWVGPSCSDRLDTEPALLHDPGAPDSASPARAADAPAQAGPWLQPVLAEPLDAAHSSVTLAKRQRLESRLRMLRSGLQGLEKAAAQSPAHALRLAFYRALCGSQPCPLGLGLRNFRILDAVGPAVHLAVAPGPGTAPLERIRGEVERQLGDEGSALRRAGGGVLDLQRSQLGLWFAKPRSQAARPQPRPQHSVVNDALHAFMVRDHWQLQNGSGNESSSLTDAAQALNQTDAAEIAGIKQNTADDLKAFFAAVGLNAAIIVICIVLLSFLRRAFPTVYEGNQQCESSFFGWLRVCFSMSTQEIMDKAGLDHAMLVEFSNLSMRILVIVGLPLVLVMAPLHYWCGGNAAGNDKLSWFSMGNVQQGSWLCWVHAFVVWYVVIATQKTIFASMRRDFIPKRFRFLKDMPEPRATSVLVEGIPEDKCKEEELRKYFDDGVFGRPVVRHAYFVKQTADLMLQQRHLDRAKEVVDRARLAGVDPLRLARLEKTEREVERSVEELRRKINFSDDDNSRNAFVTFETRRDAAIALKLFSPDDAEEVVVTIPPDPSDIIWSDLLVDPNLQAFREIVGYLLVIALLVSFMPIVIYIARFAALDNVKDNVPFFESLVNNYPKLATLWNGLVGSAALSLMMSVLPMLLVLVIGNLFVLRAQAWLQLYLQGTYYYFLIIYVLLVTAVGSSLIETAKYLAQHPMEVFVILADKMPSRTHFYLSYLSVQCGTHAINLLRYANLFKFVAFALVYDKAQAKEWSEPEDQDYYGMGSRSARFSLLLVISLVFCSLTPLMTIIGFINFFLSRMFYPYLFVFSEVRKADLGGVFWFESLKHVQQGLFLYVALMTGVLMERASTLFPAGITLLCLMYCISEYRYFLREFRWELLEFHELKGERSKMLKGVSYKQPELISVMPEEPAEQQATGISSAQDLFQALQTRLGTVASALRGGSAVAPGSAAPAARGGAAPAAAGAAAATYTGAAAYGGAAAAYGSASAAGGSAAVEEPTWEDRVRGLM